MAPSDPKPSSTASGPNIDGGHGADREEAPSRPSSTRAFLQSTVWLQTMRLTGLWVEILASIAIPGLIGFGLDKWLNTSPWIMIAGLIIGAFGGIYGAVKKANRVFDIGEDHESAASDERKS